MPILIKCSECKKYFFIKPYRLKNKGKKYYCSKKCYLIYNHKRKVIKKCKNCKKRFQIYYCLKNRNFCSKKCLLEFHNLKTKCSNCKKNMQIWKSHKHKNNFCSKNCRDKYLKKHLNKGCFQKAEKHFNWKGDKVKYMGVHKWLNVNYSKPLLCQDCNKKKKLELANISGEYKRDIRDYKYLCRSCHIKFDRTNIKIIEDEIVSIKKEKCNEIFYDIETETENFIANGLITHNSKRSKKSVAVGCFLPSTLKEKVECIISIDTSGSIGQKELSDFLSEIIGLSKAFSQNIDMRLICQDVKIHEDIEIKNGNVQKIKKIRCKGGGGTSHIEVFDTIKKKYRNTKVVIFLTDGYSDLENINFDDYKFQKIFVISKGGTDEWAKNKKCIIIKLKETY